MHFVRQLAGPLQPGVAANVGLAELLHTFVDLVVLGQRVARRAQAHVVHQDRGVQKPLFRSRVGRQLDTQGLEQLAAPGVTRLGPQQPAA